MTKGSFAHLYTISNYYYSTVLFDKKKIKVVHLNTTPFECLL